MRPSQILAAVVAMSSVTHAMSDAFDNIHGMTDVKNVLFGRQDDSTWRKPRGPRRSLMNTIDSDNASSDKPSSTQAQKTSSAANTSEKPTATQSGNNDNDNNSDDDKSTSGKATSTGKQSGSKTTGKGSKSTSFDARLPAGGLTMVTPNALAGTQFYKVGDWVTFAWNYTSVSVMPTAIDVLASCTANQATYTIAVNMSAKHTEVLWNTGETPEGQAPFLTENYKLMIYDSDSSVTAPARAGYLSPFSGYTFGMYLKQPYTSLEGTHLFTLTSSPTVG
jgi:hypothetical protein